jgi:uncharacterized cofD-like protein
MRGQVTIERATGIDGLRFDPADPSTPPEAVAAILDADQIVIGPGSLFTSVLAAAVAPDVLAALHETDAQRVFVANVANDRAEARGFDLLAHVEAIRRHDVPIDVVLAHHDTALSAMGGAAGVPTVVAEVAAEDGWGHDPELLAAALSDLYADDQV